MQNACFFKLGKLIYKLRFAVLIVFSIVIFACIPCLKDLTSPFKSTGFINNNSPSAQTKRDIQRNIGYSSNKFIIIYRSKKLVATDPLYISKLKDSVESLKDFPLKHVIIFPDENKKQIAKDQHTAYIVILFHSDRQMNDHLLVKFKKSIKKPTDMSMQLGGESLLIESINKQTQRDLFNADYIAAPLSLIILIIVFESLIAALFPVLLGGGCALIVLMSLYFLGQILPLSIFTINIALLLGLCLSLDYALFIINRFRDELAANSNIEDVIAKTMSSAGRAIFFSGLAVLISISALLLFPISILFSIGVGGMVAVLTAVIIALLVLPAILSIIKSKINLFSVRIFKRKAIKKTIWHKVATEVVRHPLIFFAISLIILLLLGTPFINAKIGISNFRILPQKAEGRQFFELYNAKFNINELSPITILVTSKHENILTEKNLSKLIVFCKKLQKNSRIKEVNSIVTTEPKLNAKQYFALYTNTKNSSIKKILTTTTAKHLTTINVVSKYKVNSLQTKKLIAELLKTNPGKNLKLQLTGVPVNNTDVLQSITQVFPYALIWIISLTYLILLILLRSIFLPLKAILMNILSLSASYGVLVFVFQEGHFHQYLNFDPQGMVDLSLLVIIFCALFGFSMDYEVFLLTRIKEYYEKSHNNEQSIIFGIERSSRIITSAAIIVILISASFMVAQVLMVKEFGLGIAVAIFVDAFLVRTILVPATMTLVKSWNWYIPKWLDKILPRI